MKQFIFLLALLFAILMSCQKDYDKTKSPSQFLPSETNSVLLINELNDFTKSIENHNILSGIYNEELKTSSTLLENLNTTKQVYVAFLNESSSDYLVLTESDSTLFIVDSIPNHISETLTNLKINKTQIDSTVFYHKTLGNVFVASNNMEVVKILDSKNENQELTGLIETTDNEFVASLVFKMNSPDYSKLLLSHLNDSINKNYTVLDLNFSEKHIKYNGIISSGDSIRHYVDCFKNTIPQKTNSLRATPSNTNSLLSIAFDDFSIFNKNLSQLKQLEIDSTQSFLNFTNEIALTDDAIILHSLDPDLVLETIEEKSYIETYRDIDIYEFGTTEFFKSRLLPFISFEQAKYFLNYDDFIIFSDSTETLKKILSSILSNNTIANTDAFKNISENISDEASILIFKNAKALSNVLGTNTKGYDANVVQFVYENNYAHVNGAIQEFNKRAPSNSVSEAFTTSIDAPILFSPQTVKNHITKANDIVVQDIDNVLYLISSSGNILWKKQLQGKILGKIEQIDMYKNGRLQLAFATPKRLYVLDRNGNDVSPFPYKFNDEITQPLSVFDYDKRKNYRLLITQGKNLLMYDARGKSVNGFNYKTNGSDISTQPKHFRIGNKDYIAFTTGDKLNILNRQGRIRIDVKEKIRFSENELYLYKNKFTSTNTLGQLVQVNTKGNLSKKNLDLTDEHHIVTTSKTLVSMTENRLNIKSKSIDLDYGEYTEPRIFYLNDKIYVTTTDIQSKKVYLFDSQAKPIPNFPVFGTSAAELQKLDKERGLELITQADDKTIIVYKLH
ncbi:ribonuclease HII [Winogradskyella sp.]|uniref:ribonuclease HII n=1 Tax=Winogradskyella sp. TaxID=1883156 RepID=UPI0026162A65|nr:ribonuclease HII [Winogradskyella sp.]